MARAAALLAVAVLPVVAGISGDDYEHPAAFMHGFRIAMITCAALLVIGGLISVALIRNPDAVKPRPEPPERKHYCSIDGPPVQAKTVRSGAADLRASVSWRARLDPRT